MINLILSAFEKDIQELIKGSAVAFIVRIFGVFALYGLTLFITNKFGSTVYGEFSFFILSLKMLSLFAVAGIDVYILRYISDDPVEEKISNLVNKSSLAVLANGIIILLFLFIILSLKPNLIFENPSNNHLIYLSLIPLALLRLNTESFRAIKKTLAYSIFEYFSLPFSAIIFAFILSYSNESSSKIPTQAYTFAILSISFISFLFWQRKYLKTINGSFLKSIKGIFDINKLAVPFLISGSIVFIGQWTISLILKSIEGSDALGIFDGALKISALLSMPLIAASVVIAPIISNNYSKSKFDSIKLTMKRVTKISILITLPIMIIFFIYSNEFMLLYGSDFQNSSHILRIILIGLMFNVVTGPVAVLLQMTENQKIVQNVFLASTLLNVILALILINNFGLMGAAIANLIFQVVINLTLLVYTFKKFRFLTFY